MNSENSTIFYNEDIFCDYNIYPLDDENFEHITEGAYIENNIIYYYTTISTKEIKVGIIINNTCYLHHERILLFTSIKFSREISNFLYQKEIRIYENVPSTIKHLLD